MAAFSFVYPVYIASQGKSLPGYEDLVRHGKKIYIIPDDATGHIWSSLREAYLCDGDLTSRGIAESCGCKKTTKRSKPVASRQLCPACLAVYLKLNTREAARWRAWQE